MEIEVVIINGKAREVNNTTNPSMGKRHADFESMLRTFEIDKCDGFCSDECAVKGCEVAPIEGKRFLGEVIGKELITLTRPA